MVFTNLGRIHDCGAYHVGQDSCLWCLPYGAGYMPVVFTMWGRIHACVFTNWGRIHDCGVYQLG